MPTAAEVYLGLGSNLGCRRQNIADALDRLRTLSSNLVVSSFSETAPVGVTFQPSFVNAVCRIRTTLSPFELLHEIRRIQPIAGSRRPILNGPRALDIDILLYGSIVIDAPHLTIPHPRMTEREFVLRPLVEIAPQAIHPVRKKTVSQLLAEWSR